MTSDQQNGPVAQPNPKGCLAKGCLVLVLGSFLLFFYETLIPWMFFWKFTPAISGVVVDETTGKGVPDTLVRMTWFYRRGFFVDSETLAEEHLAATDSDGRFAIPRRRVTKPISKFAGTSLIIRHPLYDPKEIWMLLGEDLKPIMGTIEGRKLVLEVPIQTLEERYSKPEDNAKLASLFDSITPQYFELMRVKFGVRYDIEECLTKWGLLANRFPEGNQQRGYEQVQRDFKLLERRFRNSFNNK